MVATTNTATTGSLEKAQNVVLAKCRYTYETATPTKNLVEKFTLGKGQKQLTVPKLGAAPTANKLTDGVDMTTSETLRLTTTDLTTGEAGLKFILTDKLIRQFNEDVFKMVGRQLGQSIANLQDDDLIALFSSATYGSGAAAATLKIANFLAASAKAKLWGFPTPISCVVHPYTAYLLASTLGIYGTYAIPEGFSADLLKNFYVKTLDGIGIYTDARIVPDGSDDAYGAMFSKSAIAFIESQAPNVERERDASLRAWEVNYVTDYGVFLLDAAQIQYMLYDASTPSTTA